MKSLAVLGLARLGIPKKIERSRFMVTSMTANANFTTPSPPLATITTNINALETAYIAAQGGGADDTANMRAKETTLDLSLKALAGYVETTANASPLNAEAIILSAGMNVKAKGSRTVNDFDVKYTGNPGEVKLIRKSIKRGSYEFQMTTDPTNAANWQKIYSGTRGRLVKSGLTSGTRYHFRVATIDKNGMGPWSDVKSMIAI
jgi:hypothetical protein